VPCSRRDFLTLSATLSAGVLLGACRETETAVVSAPSPTTVSPAIEASPTATSRPPATPTVGPERQAPAAATTPLPAKEPPPAPGKPGGQPPPAGAKPKGKEPAVAPAPADSRLLADAILGRPTATSVTANVVPSVPLSVSYEYGTTPGVYTLRTAPQAASAAAPLETTIGGLQPNTRYYYRLRAGESAGQECTFVTQRAPGSAFVFAIQGDSHPERLDKEFDPVLYERTLRGAAADRPDFYITIGDDFSVDQLNAVNPETVRALYLNQRRWLGLVGSPLFLVNGNHEQAALANLDGTLNNVAVWAQTARNTYLPQPAPDAFYAGDTEPVPHIGLLRDYYSFTWGDALYVVIDPYWLSPQTVDNQFGGDREDRGKRDLWQITLGQAQYEWFQRTLATSPAKYKFVFTHHVLGTGRGGVELAKNFEWGDASQFGARRPGWELPIHQLMARNHVTIFFQGHDHVFVHQELDGVVYQTLPEPANPFYTYENADAYRSGDKLPNSGHLRVSVGPAGVKVDYVRSYLDKADELAFSYTVR
jgi:hypothetical protein